MKTLVAVPCGDLLHTDFARSLLGMGVSGAVQYTFAQGSLVYDSRNQLSDLAIESGFDRVLWLDSDMVFTNDLFMKLSADLDEGREIVSGLCFTRKRPIHPAVYKAIYRDSNGVPHADPITEWSDQVFEVGGCGFAAVMMNVELLKRIREEYKRLYFSPIPGFGEDFSFCLRCQELGVKIYCDPTIRIGHIGLAVYDENVYRIEVSRNE